MDEHVSGDEQREATVRFVEGLVEVFDAEAEVVGRVDEEDEVVGVDIEGESLGHLIGPGAATLEALEELAQAVLQRETGGGAMRVRVDVGGYRERRREALERFTEEVAGGVRDSGDEIVLEPMNPADRKVVHDVVAELDGLTTASVGEEPRRRVVIKPE